MDDEPKKDVEKFKKIEIPSNMPCVALIVKTKALVVAYKKVENQKYLLVTKKNGETIIEKEFREGWANVESFYKLTQYNNLMKNIEEVFKGVEDGVFEILIERNKNVEITDNFTDLSIDSLKKRLENLPQSIKSLAVKLFEVDFNEEGIPLNYSNYVMLFETWIPKYRTLYVNSPKKMLIGKSRGVCFVPTHRGNRPSKLWKIAHEILNFRDKNTKNITVASIKKNFTELLEIEENMMENEVFAEKIKSFEEELNSGIGNVSEPMEYKEIIKSAYNYYINDPEAVMWITDSDENVIKKVTFNNDYFPDIEGVMDLISKFDINTTLTGEKELEFDNFYAFRIVKPSSNIIIDDEKDFKKIFSGKLVSLDHHTTIKRKIEKCEDDAKIKRFKTKLLKDLAKLATEGVSKTYLMDTLGDLINEDEYTKNSVISEDKLINS